MSVAQNILSPLMTGLLKIETLNNLGLIINFRYSWNSDAAKISQRTFIGHRSLWPQSK